MVVRCDWSQDVRIRCRFVSEFVAKLPISLKQGAARCRCGSRVAAVEPQVDEKAFATMFDPEMIDPKLLKAMDETAHAMLEWIGFGTLVGLTAKAIMPGRDPGGAVVTLVIGIAGCVIGCGIAMYAFDSPRLTPISTLGFFASTGGAFILLALYRLMAGRVVREGVDPDVIPLDAPRRRRRRRAA